MFDGSYWLNSLRIIEKKNQLKILFILFKVQQEGGQIRSKAEREREQEKRSIRFSFIVEHLRGINDDADES